MFTVSSIRSYALIALLLPACAQTAHAVDYRPMAYNSCIGALTGILLNGADYLVSESRPTISQALGSTALCALVGTLYGYLLSRCTDNDNQEPSQQEVAPAPVRQPIHHDPALEQWKRELGIKQCIYCGFGIQKNGGCNVMMCSLCREEFCWLCLAPRTHEQQSCECPLNSGF